MVSGILTNSNGFKIVNMKKKKTPKDIFKLVWMTLGVILLAGFLFQCWINFVADETLKPKINYATVNGKRLDYRLRGSGSYTIIFDGAIGTTLEGWNNLTKELENSGAYTFVYNRPGYGYSNTNSKADIEKQAEDLKILLRKSGAPEPYILVGEEYGSLLLTSFAEKFEESILGVILVNPVDQEYINSGDFGKNNALTILRRKIENLGTYCGLTTLLDKANLDVDLKGYEDLLEGKQLEEFKIQRTKTNYTSAVLNELNTLSKGNINIQKEGMFDKKPYYLVSSEENTAFNKLGEPDITKIVNSDSEFVAMSEIEEMIKLIEEMIEETKYKR